MTPRRPGSSCRCRRSARNRNLRSGRPGRFTPDRSDRAEPAGRRRGRCRCRAGYGAPSVDTPRCHALHRGLAGERDPLPSAGRVVGVEVADDPLRQTGHSVQVIREGDDSTKSTRIGPDALADRALGELHPGTDGVPTEDDIRHRQRVHGGTGILVQRRPGLFGQPGGESPEVPGSSSRLRGGHEERGERGQGRWR